MTFILAANLSDRIHLASDTKITKPASGGRKEIVGYGAKLQQYANKDRNGFISCMYAGNKKFAQFLSNAISTAIYNRELTTDINTLQNEIEPFLKELVPKYTGQVKEICMIFAGVSLTPYKVFNLKRLDELLGPEAFKLDDIRVVEAIQTVNDDGLGIFFTPDQKAFSFEIHERGGKFGVSEVAGAYSLICAGSHTLTEEKKKDLLRYFISRRDIEDEAKDIVNFLRSTFSESVGGAVMMGYIRPKGGMTNVGYDIDRSGKCHDSNWSFAFINNKMIATDPGGKTYDLVKGFFSDDGDMDINL